MDNELILFDRLEVIKTTMKKYGIENFYLSFSGGRDSTVVHHLLDMAIPGNTIPRVFMNTGIEYLAIVNFVKSLAENDSRFVMLKPQKTVRKTLEENGYPFKSKEYSQWYSYYPRNKEQFNKYRRMIEEDPGLLEDFDFIHNLPSGVKWLIKQYYGVRERERDRYQYAGIP